MTQRDERDSWRLVDRRDLLFAPSDLQEIEDILRFLHTHTRTERSRLSHLADGIRRQRKTVELALWGRTDVA